MLSIGGPKRVGNQNSYRNLSGDILYNFYTIFEFIAAHGESIFV